MMNDRTPAFLIACGAFAAALGVAIGAFGAHGLRAIVSPEHLATFETGVRYHMYHAFGLLILGVTLKTMPAVRANILLNAGRLFCAGIVFFSGSLYLLVMLNLPLLGAVTPIGGVCFIAGWILFGWEMWMARHRE
jgi:uncharacterized membrane protein YgdD (TMEM256/DUF423 family)